MLSFGLLVREAPEWEGKRLLPFFCSITFYRIGPAAAALPLASPAESLAARQRVGRS